MCLPVKIRRQGSNIRRFRSYFNGRWAWAGQNLVDNFVGEISFYFKGKCKLPIPLTQHLIKQVREPRMQKPHYSSVVKTLK